MMITENYTALTDKINKAIKLAERPAHSCQLIAVTKTVEMERIAPLLALNHRHFGENYVQEATLKWQNVKSDKVTLHLIGALQSNKAEEAVALFDVIHTLDRMSLATALKKACVKLNKTPKLFVQVNIGEEPQKGGVLPKDADIFIKAMREDLDFNIEGLMCIPPDNRPPAPYFAFLNLIAKRNALPQLSMGMSADYDAAIHTGATFVRVGSSLFGARAKKE
jgi:PLP dependent protein